MAVLESLYKDDMTYDEAKDLAIRAIEAGKISRYFYLFIFKKLEIYIYI
jgi:hypothetical protein